MYFFNFRANIINITNIIRLKGLGECSKLPQRDPSGVRPKMEFMHISNQKEAIWNTLFSIFERWWGLQTSRSPGKLPTPPLDGPKHKRSQEFVL